MREQREFISETFHALAQPITLLRATVELGLLKIQNDETSKQVLGDCLYMIDRLMQDLSILREIAILENAPPLQSCLGNTLVESCVEEMAPVAQDSGVTVLANTERVSIECNEAMFQRAIFLLLDATIASTPLGGTISVSLRRREDGVLLEVGSGALQGPREKLCLKLMQYAGAHSIRSESGSTSAIFRESSQPASSGDSAG
jgi:signal transduction histidine kinase